MSLFLKNTTGASGVWAGQTIASGAYHLASQSQIDRFSRDDATLASVGSGDLVVALANDGSADLSISLGVAELLGQSPVKTLSAPFPDASEYFFRGQGVKGTLTRGVTSGSDTINALMDAPRYIYGCEIILPDTAPYGLTVDFKVVDVDNVLGYGANFEVEQFGYTWNLDPREKNTAFPGYTAFIPQGLYIQCLFNDIPALTTINNVGINMYLHERVV
jgi:hypothetical protein